VKTLVGHGIGEFFHGVPQIFHCRNSDNRWNMAPLPSTYGIYRGFKGDFKGIYRGF
jgi:methionine aminopeptidase